MLDNVLAKFLVVGNSIVFATVAVTAADTVFSIVAIHYQNAI